MLETMERFADAVLGLGEESFDLSAWQMALRALVVYIVAIALVRLGDKRFMGRNSAFDLVLAIIIGSILSRAITGQAPLVPTIAAGAALVFLHWLLAAIAYYVPSSATLVKGSPRVLIREGQVQRDAMRRSHMGKEDLTAALRSQAKITDPAKVELAQLERDGSISVIPRSGAPQIVDIQVEDGVQVVRIKLEN